MKNLIIQGLWVGGRLSTMEWLSIASFIRHGHEYHLYVYEDVKKVPKGTILKSADEIVSREQVFKEKNIDSYGAFSDIFRFKLLFERGGWWADTDVICLRPFDFEADYVFAEEGLERSVFGVDNRVNPNVMKTPARCDIMRFCSDLSLQRSSGEFKWGDIGPAVITEAVKKFELTNYVLSYKTFNPIDYWNWKDIITEKPGVRLKIRLKLKKAHAVHLWNSLWTCSVADKDKTYHTKCLYGRLKRKYIDFEDLAFFKGEAFQGPRTDVSIIMTFLNEERFIKEAIKSVFAQTYDNWELLLVDDGSIDRSTEIALKYARQYPGKVRYLEHEGHQNKGAAASRNLGMAHARGELIGLLDADDVWLPDKLERQVSIMERYPDIALVLNPVFFWHEDGKKEPQSNFFPGKQPPRAGIYKILEDFRNAIGPSAVLVKKKVIVEVGGFEESFQGPLHLLEDSAVMFKINLNAAVYCDPEYMTLYRVHPGSCWMSGSLEEKLSARTHLFSWFIHYLKDTNHSELISDMMDRMMITLNCRQLRHFMDANELRASEVIIQWAELQLNEKPKDAEWNYLSAFCLQSLQIKPEEAIHRYSVALENGFDEFWVRYNRGSLHAQLGNIEQARADLLRAVELNPNHQGARQVLQQLSSKGER